MDFWNVSEKKFRRKIEKSGLLESDREIRLQPHFAEEVHVGAFRFDLLGNSKLGGLVIVEFKVNANLDTFGQLLLYPRALALALGPKAPPITTVLVSPFIDLGVVDLVQQLQGASKPVLRLAIYDEKEELKLIEPSSGAKKFPNQCWEQATMKKQQVSWRNDEVLVRTIVLGEPRD